MYQGFLKEDDLLPVLSKLGGAIAPPVPTALSTHNTKRGTAPHLVRIASYHPPSKISLSTQVKCLDKNVSLFVTLLSMIQKSL